MGIARNKVAAPFPEGYSASFEAQPSVSFQNPLGGPRIDYPQPLLIKIYRDGELIFEQLQDPGTPHELMLQRTVAICQEDAETYTRHSFYSSS